MKDLYVQSFPSLMYCRLQVRGRGSNISFWDKYSFVPGRYYSDIWLLERKTNIPEYSNLDPAIPRGSRVMLINIRSQVPHG